jgi:hypothetical protein
MKINVYQFKIDGSKMNLRQDSLDVTGELYASIGRVPALDKYRSNDQLLLTLKIDKKNLCGNVFSPRLQKKKELDVAIYEFNGRVYLGVNYKKDVPVIIELRQSTVWFRVFQSSQATTLPELINEFFDFDNHQLCYGVQQSVLRLNASIAIGNLDMPWIKPTIY